jgi:hypothetical protein
MSPVDTTQWPSPTGVAAVLDDALRAAGGQGGLPPLTYLRRKPGRGMVAVYGTASRAGSMYTVSVDESAMARGPEQTSQVAPGTWTGESLDLFEVPSLGLTIERFPHDGRLGHLADAMSPAEGGPVWRALESTSAHSLRDVDATPVRYKPGDRCVIRYVLHTEDSTGEQHWHTLVGKLYGDLDQARAAAELMQRLWDLQDDQPWVPQPLAVAEPLPLVIAEDLGGRHSDPPTLPGTDVIRFGQHQPTDALRRAARALADLHTSAEGLPAAPARTGADEAGKAAKRAKTLGGYVPALAEDAESVAQAIGEVLTGTAPERLMPSHGSYKPSQLLFRSDSVFIIDFDQYCEADGALDVGYFLAYLRPPGLWYHRAGTRAWFDEAAATFLTAYDERLAERGVDAESRAGILRRCHAYEAALLLKVAARRANRLHSPRPGEVKALLDEMTGCLAATDSSHQQPQR